MPGEFEMKRRLQREGASSRASAESQVISAAASVSGVPEPLISNKDFDREKLARADMSQVQSIMLEYIAARRKDVRDTRGHLSGDPDLIYKLDDLWRASKAQQDIRPGTIYDLIISDKISRVHKSDALIKILLGVFTVVLSIVSFGTGTIAAVAAVGAFGLSAYQAIESFKEYEVGHAAAGAQLLSKDPSFAWVIVAFVGAAIDLGLAAKAIAKMKDAIDAFNVTGDLIKLETELTEIEKAGKITEEMRELTAKAAAAQKEYRAAMKGLAAKTLGRANMMLPLDAIPDLAKAIYYAAKRGVVSFEKFMLELKAEKAYAELTLEPEGLTKFKAAYEEAKGGLERLTSHGESLGLKEKEMDAFIESWSQNKTATVEEMKEQMTAWAATKSSGVPFGFETLEKFQEFQAAAIKGLKKAKYGDAEAILQGSSVSGISYAKKIPFGAHSDLDVAITGRSVFEKARKLGYTVERNPMRIGPLSAGQINELGLSSMQRTLEELAGGREVNFMLFGNEKAAMEGIAGVKPSSLPLRGLEK